MFVKTYKQATFEIFRLHQISNPDSLGVKNLKFLFDNFFTNPTCWSMQRPKQSKLEAKSVPSNKSEFFKNLEN